MSRVVHFEIVAADGQKAVKFYKEVFGWDSSQFGENDYWLVNTGDEREPGINGAITTHNPYNQGIVNTIGVADIDKAEKQIIEFGGEIVRPKAAIPGVGWLLYFKDPFGNISGVMQSDPNAK